MSRFSDNLNSHNQNFKSNVNNELFKAALFNQVMFYLALITCCILIIGSMFLSIHGFIISFIFVLLIMFFSIHAHLNEINTFNKQFYLVGLKHMMSMFDESIDR